MYWAPTHPLYIKIRYKGGSVCIIYICTENWFLSGTYFSQHICPIQYTYHPHTPNIGDEMMQKLQKSQPEE